MASGTGSRLRHEFYASPRLLEIYGFAPGTTFNGRDDLLRGFPFHPEDRPQWRARSPSTSRARVARRHRRCGSWATGRRAGRLVAVCLSTRDSAGTPCAGPARSGHHRAEARRGGAARVRGPLRARGRRLLRRRMGHRPRRAQRLFLPAHARAVRIASRAGGRAAGRVVRSPAAPSRGPAAALRRGERASVGKGAGVRRRVPLSPARRRLPLAPPPRRVRARCRRQAAAHGRLDERRRRPPARRGRAARIRRALRARHGGERVGILGLGRPHRPVFYLAESV